MKEDFFKQKYLYGAKCVGKYKLPQLEPTQFVPDKDDVIGFNEKKRLNKESKWVDFFIDDVNFECFWKNMDKYFSQLDKAKGIITPDYSMLPELAPGNNIWNCTRNRVCAYYLQKNGYNIIPTASWSSVEDFEWCFDGLPKNASIAVSTNGILDSPYAQKIFILGIEEMNKRIEPSHIIVCGKPFDGLEKYNNLYFYNSYSQRWNERNKNGK